MHPTENIVSMKTDQVQLDWPAYQPSSSVWKGDTEAGSDGEQQSHKWDKGGEYLITVSSTEK